MPFRTAACGSPHGRRCDPDDRVAGFRPDDRTAKPYSSWDRGRRSIAVDLKSPAGVETVLRLVDEADVFLEAFRPGVTERLGLGPEEVLGRKPDIVYGRLTGWGRRSARRPQVTR